MTFGKVYPQLYNVDLAADATDLGAPVYFAEGRHDKNAMPLLVEQYYVRTFWLAADVAAALSALSYIWLTLHHVLVAEAALAAKLPGAVGGGSRLTRRTCLDACRV